MHPNQENIFSTPIWGFMMNNQLHQNADYVDYILNLQETQYSEVKSNRGGFQSKDDLNTHGIFREFCTQLLRCSAGILENYNNFTPYILSMWANINEHGDFNFPHVHEGVLSGVFYCKTPENSGRLILQDPAVRSNAHLIKNHDFAVNPEELALIVFPSWLEHYVEPSQSEELRVSISFNIGIKEL